MAAMLLRTESLTKLFGAVIGVNDVSIDLPAGVHGLLGPNGAGKSTLIKLATGQLRPSEGRIEVLGESPWNNPKLFRRVGLCPEQDAFYWFMTGYEFVEILARMSGGSRGQVRERTERALELVAATPFMHRALSTYSKGMRQRIKVAQALVHDPELLIFDEPLSGTDPIGRSELSELIVRLGEQGKSILISSHVLHEVQAMTRSFLLIYRGRLLASGDVGEIRSLMDDCPHRLAIRCKQPRALAVALLRELPVSGVELDDTEGTLVLSTEQPASFYRELPRLAIESNAEIEEMSSEDDQLEAVFKYLVGVA